MYVGEGTSGPRNFFYKFLFVMSCETLFLLMLQMHMQVISRIEIVVKVGGVRIVVNYTAITRVSVVFKGTLVSKV